MLQQEHEKAQKKIQETSKKTEELVQRRNMNDEKYQRVGYNSKSNWCIGTRRTAKTRTREKCWCDD